MMSKRIRVCLGLLGLLFVAGCKMVPPAQAETYLQPPPQNVSHEIHFDVRPGLLAKVRLIETQINVQVHHYPAADIRQVNLTLLKEWGQRYLKVNDYDRDGTNDLAILSNAGRGGKELCYAVYRYNPQTGKFNQRKSFDRCNI